MSKTIQILIVLFCSFLGAFGQIFFKLGASSAKLNISILINYNIIIGFILYGISAIIFIYVLKFGEVSMLYPIVATSYIWVMLFAWIFLKENQSIPNFIGVCFILLGIYFIVK